MYENCTKTPAKDILPLYICTAGIPTCMHKLCQQHREGEEVEKRVRVLHEVMLDADCRQARAHLVEGAVLVVLGEGVLLQEVVLQEARRLQHDLVVLRKRVLFWRQQGRATSGMLDYDSTLQQNGPKSCLYAYGRRPSPFRCPSATACMNTIPNSLATCLPGHPKDRVQ